MNTRLVVSSFVPFYTHMSMTHGDMRIYKPTDSYFPLAKRTLADTKHYKVAIMDINY